MTAELVTPIIEDQNQVSAPTPPELPPDNRSLVEQKIMSHLTAATLDSVIGQGRVKVIREISRPSLQHIANGIATWSEVRHRQANWTKSASCASVFSELFFPAKGGSSNEAKSVCRGCPVARLCLLEAMVTRDIGGVFGGLNGRELKLLRSKLDNLTEASAE